MPKVREEKPRSFAEIVTLVEDLRNSRENPLWFRGCGRADQKLVPTLYRHQSRTKIDDILRSLRRN